MKIVIVESPEKAEVLSRILGSEYLVETGPRQVRRLAAGQITMNVDYSFPEHYEILPEGNLPLAVFRMVGREAEAIYLATNPGKEGELLAWDILECLPENDQCKASRLILGAITPETVHAALEHTAGLNLYQVRAARCWRQMNWLLDQIVTPVLEGWKLLGESLQPPRLAPKLEEVAALNLLVNLEERRREALGQPGWSIDVRLEHEGAAFWASMVDTRDLASGPDALHVIESLMEPGTSWVVEKVERHEETSAPPAPFGLLSLLGAAEKQLSFSPEQIIQAATALYDAGLVTCPLAATVMMPDTRQAARDAAAKVFGETRVSAQPLNATEDENTGVEEAIRPVDPFHLPDDILPGEADRDGRQLYGLIWRRFLASQMAPARDVITTLTIRPTWTGCAEPWEEKGTYPHPYTFQARLRRPLSDGYRAAYPDSDDDPTVNLPLVETGDTPAFLQIQSRQVVEPACERYTPAALIRLLSELKIGCPVSRVEVIERLAELGWARIERGELLPTPRGEDALYVCHAHFWSVLELEGIAGIAGRIDGLETLDKTGRLRGKKAPAPQLPARAKKWIA